MKMSKISTVGKLIAIVAVFGLLATSGSVANAAAKKTITCYKGTAVKKVTTAKCPTGWSTKKPVVKATPKATPTVASTGGTIAFKATYTGKIAMIWSDSDVSASVTGSSSSAGNAGLTTFTKATGSSAPQEQCNPINGTATLSGGGNSLTASFDTKSEACAKDDAAPTTVTVKGDAVIKSGTGKFAGATGTIHIEGTFKISSTNAGTNETKDIELVMTGNIKTK